MKQRRRKARHSEPQASENAKPPRRSWLSRHRWGLLAATLCCACACVVWAIAYDAAPPIYRYRVLNAFPHDPHAFTQGLVHDGTDLFEGTGKNGQSSLRRVELKTGRVDQIQKLSDDYFGEGITVWGDRIYQITWKAGVGFVYDKSTFAEIEQFKYEGQGWGLTHDGKHLIMSDGSSTLRFLDPKTFQVVGRLLVSSQGRRVEHLNELEYINDEILANIWYKDYIARISPETGKVTGWIDLRGLSRPRDRESVMNGIAYDTANDRLFITGKNWPRLFEIQVISR